MLNLGLMSFALFTTEKGLYIDESIEHRYCSNTLANPGVPFLSLKGLANHRSTPQTFYRRKFWGALCLPQNNSAFHQSHAQRSRHPVLSLKYNLDNLSTCGKSSPTDLNHPLPPTSDDPHLSHPKKTPAAISRADRIATLIFASTG